MKIFIARHGQTTGDIEDRYGGDYDDHLTEKGKAQAQEIAQILKAEGVEMIFDSPLQRALEAALIVSEEIGCPTEIVRGLKERNFFGLLTGMVKAEAKEKYPLLAKAAEDYHNTIQGGEAYVAFAERFQNTFLELTKRNYNKIAIVTHGGPIRVLFRHLLNLGEIKLEEKAMAVVEKEDESFKVEKLEGISLVSPQP